MIEKRHALLLAFALLFGMMLTPLGRISASASVTTIHVDPATVFAEPGEHFSLNLTIISAVDVHAWQVRVIFDPNVVQAVSATLPPDHFLEGRPQGTTGLSVSISDDRILIGCAIMGDYLGVYGNGTLVTVEFAVVGIGECLLEIDETDWTFLYDSELNETIPGPNLTTKDGYFSNIQLVTAIRVDPPMLSAEPGERFSIDLTIAYGIDVYAWQVRVFFDPEVVQPVDATLPPDHFLEGRPMGTTGLSIRISNDTVLIGCAIMGDYLGVYGNGTLVTVEFAVVGIGECLLEIDETDWTFLYDSELNETIPGLDLMTEDGYFKNFGPRFSMSASPSSLTIQQGDSAISIINVNSLGGFSDAVSLSVLNLPLGVTAILDPTHVAPPPNSSDTSSLTIQVGLTVAPESYVLTVAGKNDTLHYSIHVILGVTEPSPPYANFSYSPIDPQMNETVTFDASTSYDPDGAIVSYFWDFGDDTNSTGMTATHIYTTAGTYTVNLTVTDDDGLAGSSSQAIIIAKLSSAISISLSSSTSYVGFKVQIKGKLTYNEVGVPEAAILLSHSVTGGESWNEITLAQTAADGSYFAIWMPSATGNYLVKAEWGGDSIYLGTNVMVSLAVTPFKEQNVFSVASNSTVSELVFNSTSRELSFIVSGTSNTTGYVDVCLAKSLVGNIADVEIYLNDDQMDYTATSMDDSWLLHFTYQHSTHSVTVSLGAIVAPFVETPLGRAMIYGIPLAALAAIVLIYFFKRHH